MVSDHTKVREGHEGFILQVPRTFARNSAKMRRVLSLNESLCDLRDLCVTRLISWAGWLRVELLPREPQLISLRETTESIESYEKELLPHSSIGARRDNGPDPISVSASCA